jgi:hypothetical protein
MASAMRRNPLIPTRRSRRTPSSRGGTALVSQAYPPYIHQTLPKISIVCRRPVTVGSRASRLVSWVIVKTKTRSKNSSSELTRGSADPAEYGEGMASFTAAELTFR